jgi:hypothetical protein
MTALDATPPITSASNVPIIPIFTWSSSQNGGSTPHYEIFASSVRLSPLLSVQVTCTVSPGLPPPNWNCRAPLGGEDGFAVVNGRHVLNEMRRHNIARTVFALARFHFMTHQDPDQYLVALHRGANPHWICHGVLLLVERVMRECDGTCGSYGANRRTRQGSL